MVLRAIAGDFFRLPRAGDEFPVLHPPEDDDQGEDDVYDQKDSHEDAPEPGAAAADDGDRAPGGADEW